MKVAFGLAYYVAAVIQVRSQADRRLASGGTIENNASRQGVLWVHDLVRPLPLRFHTQVSARLLEGDLNTQAPHEQENDLHSPPGSVSCRGSDPRAARPSSAPSARWGRPISDGCSSSGP